MRRACCRLSFPCASSLLGVSLSRFLIFFVIEGIRLGVVAWGHAKAELARFRTCLTSTCGPKGARWGRKLWSCVPMALAALVTFNVSAAHGWEGVRTCVGLGLGFNLNAVYKYKVQATSKISATERPMMASSPCWRKTKPPRAMYIKNAYYGPIGHNFDLHVHDILVDNLL